MLHPTSTLRRVPLVALLLAAVACGSGGTKSETDKDEERFRADPRPLVEVSSVETGDVSDFLVTTGTVESESQVDLVPEASGTVTEIRVDEGDPVRRGQVLAVIENANLDATLARARAEMTRAQAEYDKIEALHQQGVVSDRDLTESRHALSTAQTGLLEAQSLQRHTRLISPIDGTVAVRDLQYGEVAGGQRAFQVVDLEKLRVVVRLPERDLPRLQEGLTAKLSSVYDESVSVPGTLVRISPTVDAQTGTVRATVELEAGQSTLRPGQFVSVRVEVDRHADVLVIPRRALLYEEGEPIAFRVRIEEPPPEEAVEEEEATEEEGGFTLSFGGRRGARSEEAEPDLPGPYRIARKVSLEVGYIDEDQVEILDGLELGEAIVSAGHASLRNESQVRFDGDPKLGDEDADAPTEEANAGEDLGDAEAG